VYGENLKFSGEKLKFAGEKNQFMPPTPPGKKSQDDDVRMWLPLHPHSIAWNALGFSDADAQDSKNFVPACAFFFYIPELPTKSRRQQLTSQALAHKVQGSHESCRLQ
jgi:hypothetical protein